MCGQYICFHSMSYLELLTSGFGLDVLHQICPKKVESSKSCERFNLGPLRTGFTFLLMDSANIFNAIEMKSSPALEIAEKKIGTNLFHVNLFQIDVI